MAPPAPDKVVRGQAPSGPQAPDPRAGGDDSPAAFVKTFPCGGCGAKLTFAPGTTTLKCEYCGHTNAIHESDERIEELDFDTYLKALEGNQETFTEEHVRCDKCGAEQNLPSNLFASMCSFCGANIVSKSYANRRIKPKSIIPFGIDKRKAQDDFRKWVRGLWLAPGELKKYAESDASVTGTYIPFWTYDCRTSTDYRGERGEVYYTNETREVRNAQGETVTQTERVQHTNWTPASGHVDYFHDDVLVLGSQTLPRELRGATTTWDLKALVPYQAEFVSGYRAEAYQVGLREGYPLAKEQIDAKIYSLVRADIGGDTQRVNDLATRYSDIKFKHVLLPVWVSAYRFRNKTYRFLVNGQTGEVAGESPLSWQKMTWLIVGIVILVLVAIALSGGHHR
jgi:LSD1 subclass zinc finger protein